jgi:hypothetical protein
MALAFGVSGMSVSVMTAVWNSQTDFSPSELLILLALADWANDDGYCWPAVPTLARKARMKDRNAQWVLKKVAGEGFIEVLPNQGPKGANMYRVLVQILHRCKRPEGVQNGAADGAKSGAEGVQNPAGGGAKNGDQGVHDDAPKPSLDTPVEPPEEPSHTTQDGLRAADADAPAVVVGVCGKFPRKTYKRYARNHHSFANPAGFATAARRSGEWDEDVAEWCAKHGIDPFTGEPAQGSATPPPSQQSNTADCPDCQGKGFYYPDPANPSKGVARCRHPHLVNAA